MKVNGLIGGMSWNSTSERVMRGNTCLECDIEAIAVTYHIFIAYNKMYCCNYLQKKPYFPPS